MTNFISKLPILLLNSTGGLNDAGSRYVTMSALLVI